MQAPLGDARALTVLRDELNDLATELGRTPSAMHVQTLLARLGLDRRHLQRLLDRPTPQPLIDHAQPPPSSQAKPDPSVPTSARPVLPLPASGRQEGRDPTSAAAAYSRSPEATSPADEDDWNGSDPFAVDDPKPPSVLTQDAAVARLAEDLAGELSRSGHLYRSALTSLARRRGLSAEQVEDTLLELESRGVDVEEDDAPAGYDGQHDLDGGAVRRRVGSAERDQLASYLGQLRRYPLLTAEDEVRLGRAIAAGRQAEEELAKRACRTGSGREAKDDIAGQLARVASAGRRAHEQMVCANLRLVVSIAKLPKFAYCGVDLPDRIQDGNGGLMHAVDMFDPELGFKFSTYATWWIRQKIDRGIADRGRLIRLPVHMHEQVRKLHAARFRLEHELGRASTVPELANRTGQEPGKVAAMLRYGLSVGSLDATVGTDGDTTFGDLLSLNADVDGRLDPANVVLNAALDRELAAALDCALSARDAHIIRRRYGLDGQPEQTLREIGADLGLTRERIRQIETKALARLSTHGTSTGLFEYLIDTARVDTVQPQSGDRGQGLEVRACTARSAQAENHRQDPRGEGRPGGHELPPHLDDTPAPDAGDAA